MVLAPRPDAGKGGDAPTRRTSLRGMLAPCHPTSKFTDTPSSVDVTRPGRNSGFPPYLDGNGRKQGCCGEWEGGRSRKMDGSANYTPKCKSMLLQTLLFCVGCNVLRFFLWIFGGNPPIWQFRRLGRLGRGGIRVPSMGTKRERIRGVQSVFARPVCN